MRPSQAANGFFASSRCGGGSVGQWQWLPCTAPPRHLHTLEGAMGAPTPTNRRLSTCLGRHAGLLPGSGPSSTWRHSEPTSSWPTNQCRCALDIHAGLPPSWAPSSTWSPPGRGAPTSCSSTLATGRCRCALQVYLSVCVFCFPLLLFFFLFLAGTHRQLDAACGLGLQQRCSRAERLHAKCGVAMTCCAARSP